jgi:uncharacterized protein (DUF2267 family)
MIMPIAQDLRAAISETEAWIDDVMQRLGWHDRERAYLVLSATMHALRDSLPQDEAIYIGAQLPPLLRGFYYEGWHPGAHLAAKSRSASLERIFDGVHRDPAIDVEQAARVVFAALAVRLPAGELEDAKAATPQPLHNLWPS